MRPTVSIVLPTRDGSKFISKSIDSCLSQTYRDWHLVIVDDGSTDATAEIVHRYSVRDSRIAIVPHATSQGVAHALNSGFAHAAGEYLTWTSDDNWFRPNALERLTAVLNARPEVSLVYSDYSVVDPSGQVVECRIALPPERLAEANCVGASFLYRRAVHETLNGFDTARPLVEDYDFWLRAAERFRLLPVNEDLYVYRLHPSSLSTRFDRAILDAHRSLMRHHLESMRSLSARARAAACVHLARATLGRGHVGAAAADLWLGCRIHTAAVVADCAGRAYRSVSRRLGAAH